MNEEIIFEEQYNQAADVIKNAILQGQYEASKEVNRVQIALYYGIGRYLSQHTRRNVWGIGALKAISCQLRKTLPGLRGFSETSLKKMRLFYEHWQFIDGNSSVATDELEKIHNSSVATDECKMIEENVDVKSVFAITDLKSFPLEDFFRVPFTHHVEIFSHCDDLLERYYYIHRTAEEHLSVEKLKELLASDEYHHQSLLPNNFPKTIIDAKEARKAVMMFKDEYALDFINVEEIGERDAEDVDERVVEKQVIQNIKQFIMTFGQDFAFIGNQYHLEAYSEEFFPDLLFFNRELNAMVCVELKTGKFKPSYLGQLAAYLRILDDKVKKPHENPSIGIVLCKEVNKRFVEYIVQDYDKPMGVATYSVASKMPEKIRKALPDIEDLRRLL